MPVGNHAFLKSEVVYTLCLFFGNELADLCTQHPHLQGATVTLVESMADALWTSQKCSERHHDFILPFKECYAI